jgi:hypothetical protein
MAINDHVGKRLKLNSFIKAVFSGEDLSTVWGYGDTIGY